MLPDSSKPAADPHGPMIRVVIPSGTDAVGIGGILEQDGVVSDGGRFRNYAKEQGEGSSLQGRPLPVPGGHRLRRDHHALDTGAVPVRLTKLVIPEGFRISEIAARVPTVGISTAAYKRALAAARRRPPVRLTPAAWRASCSRPPTA